MANITIKQKPISYKIEKKVQKYVHKSRNFGKPNLHNLEKISKKYMIDVDIVKSMVSSYTKDKIIINYTRLLDRKRDLYEAYNSGVSILDLSKKYNNSPMTIYRIILRAKGLIKKQIKKVLDNPNKYLISERDKKQLEIALANDRYASIDLGEQLKKSLEYEKELQDFLDKHNVQYKTQEGLVSDTKNIIVGESGNPLTPDFLISSNFKINGKQINWIDAKNFYGAYTHMNKYKLKKQADKYNKVFGSGAFIFSLNYSERLSIRDTLLLSISNKGC